MVLNSEKPIQRYFEEISQIPRETEHEEMISDYIIKFAKDRNLWYRRDELWNVLVKKTASPGYENAKPVILQAHMDMVCARTNDSTHDFRKDPIEFVLNGKHLTAKDTSLGADDGFGVAYILAILDDDTLKHPALECVFTTQEEHKTMVGAEHFDVSDLTAKRMIGLDGDGETVTFVSSACSDLITIERTTQRVPVLDTVCAFEISKLTGSVIRGVNNPECANAVKMSFRLLMGLLQEGVTFGICSVDGGIGENRSPQNCRTVLSCMEKDKKQIATILQKEFDAMMTEYTDSEFTGKYHFEDSAQAEDMISETDSADMIKMMYLIPNNMFQGDVTTGEMKSIITLGIAKTEKEKFSAIISARSLCGVPEEEAIRHIKVLSEALGFEMKRESRYFSWEYDKDSKLRKLFNEIYMEKQGVTLSEEICPGGLEVSWFFSKIEGLDVLMLGPVHENVHTVDEFMDLDSFDRVYEILIEALERMKE